MLKSSPPSWVIILALWAAGLGAAMQFAKVSVTFPELQQIYPDAAGAGLGFVLSLISFLGIGFGLIAGQIVARMGFRRLLIGGLLFGAAVSVVQALFPPLPAFLLARVVEGASHLVIVVAAPTLMAVRAAPGSRHFALALWSTFFGVAYALVSVVGPPMIAAMGPGSLYVAHAGYMVVMACVLVVLLPRDTRVAQKMPSLRDIVQAHLGTYASPRRAAPALGWLFYTLSYVSLLTVLPVHLPEAERPLTMFLMPLAGIVVSLTVAPIMLRRFGPVRVLQSGFALACGIAVAMMIVPLSGALCIAVVAALGLVQSGSFASVPQLNETAEDQALANGAMAQMGNLGNTLGTPVMLGFVFLFGLHGVFGMLAGCFTLGFLGHAWMAARRGRTIG